MIFKVFWKKKFSFPQDMFWTIWLHFRLPHQKVCWILKSFWSANFEELTLFFQNLFFKVLLETWNSAMTNLTKKVCQKLSFSARIAKLTLKSAFFENFFFQKVSNGHKKWSAVLTTLRKVARQKSLKPIWAEWVKVWRFTFFIFCICLKVFRWTH